MNAQNTIWSEKLGRAVQRNHLSWSDFVSPGVQPCERCGQNKRIDTFCVCTPQEEVEKTLRRSRVTG